MRDFYVMALLFVVMSCFCEGQRRRAERAEKGFRDLVAALMANEGKPIIVRRAK